VSDTGIDEASAGLTTQPESDATSPTPAGIGVSGWLRWAWRTLTSMRAALILLFLLAVAAIPGSTFPQRGTNPVEVSQYIVRNPTWGPVLNRLGMFDVFAAPWFAAIYLLLMASLAGCVIPRTRLHWRAMRAQPPAAPSRLSRLPEHRTLELECSPADVLTAAETVLRAQRWRVRREVVESGESTWVAGEKGYLRETGNLLFHLALLALLVAVAAGGMFGAKGQVIVREGSAFSNTLTQYDSFSPGRLFKADRLVPFTVRLDQFRATYQEDGMQRGAPREFAADVVYSTGPGTAERKATIGVNEPLAIDGTKVFLVGHGYAPTFVIKDATGKVLLDDSVVFLPQDGNFTSDGVLKIPDATPQIGFTGVFLPTAERDPVRGGFSSFPAPLRPEVFLSVWRGDLGLDKGTPQSVYRLDTSSMERLGLKNLKPGQTWTLPDGLGTLTFTGVSEYATFNVASDPGSGWALAAAVMAIVGLSLSLFVRRRRLWVRVPETSPDSMVEVEFGALGRSEAPGLDQELDSVVAAVRRAVKGV